MSDAFDATRTRGKSAAQIHPVARFPEEWAEWFIERGERSFRGRQLFQWIHQRRIFDPEKMTNVKKVLRQALAQEGLSAPVTVEEVQRSADGTRKLLLRLQDGRAVECVLIPMSNEDDADVAAAASEDPALHDPDDALDDVPPDEAEPPTRGSSAPARPVTLCVSTQVGCAMGCVFCASGKAGLTRGLGAAEVVSQVLVAKSYLDPEEQLRNIVFMGMGEPLHHYDETLRALRLITHADGLAMSPRRITVSTVGLVPNIAELGRDFDGKIGLAVSLHAPDDETRDRIMPVNKRFDVAQLLEGLRRYPLPSRRRITVEYTLIAEVNDTPQHARKLVQVLRGLRVKVNLIPLNPIAGSELRTPSDARVDAFRDVLAEARVSCSVRRRRGDDVDAACGQLALRNQPASDTSKRRLPLEPKQGGG